MSTRSEFQARLPQLLERVRQGDQPAFRELVEHFQDPLFGFLGRLGLPPQQCEEIAQETFLRAWCHLGSYRDSRAAFSTWLYTIARHLASDELSRASRRHEWVPDGPLPDAVCPQPLPEQRLAARQDEQALRRALARIPWDDRSLVALAYAGELALSEVAAIEGISIGAVKTRLHRIRARLRRLLEEDHD